ncbi:MAG: alpha/beta hydrolase [Proteobacteria bacterium]|nr:alpha/beta hydrolase [Burkholderiales bacterium]MCA0309419.1 alpha/beta hydrolase [Pseudomonadota bacterium]
MSASPEPLGAADDPDGQPPLPPAFDYARTVMAWSREPLPERVVATLGQAYGPHRLQRFDVYAPRGAHAAPVVLHWHGGGWTNGYRQWVRFMAPHVTQLGAVLVAPSYRLTPEHPFPAAIDDALDVLGVLRERVAEWGGAADRLYLSGHSAGGHLAAMAALSQDARRRRGVRGEAIRACLPLSGIMDLQAADPAPGSLEERVYTHVLRGLDAAQDVVYSPLSWTAGKRIPFDLTVGERDSARVRRSNQRLHALLAAQGVPVALHEAVGRDHFQTHLDLRQADHPWYARLAALIRRTS